MRYDVLIVGGGIVGAAFALALRGSGLTIGLIEPRRPGAPADEAFDHRVYALNAASLALLSRLRAWARVPAERVARIEAMQVWGDDDARLDFSAQDAHLDDLAVVVENKRLTYALWQELSASSEITCIVGKTAEVALPPAGGACVTLEDGRFVDSTLLVAADGADSRVRKALEFAVEEKDYRQTALVANFACARSHGGIARQWFRRDGVLAFLPLPGERMSIVWSVESTEAQRLAGLSAEAFAREVAEAGQEELGELQPISAVGAFPLRLLRVRQTVRPHVALIGDAAHVVHPLAGQGVNLGLQDAAELAHTVAARAVPEGCGDYAVLRRYERSRKEAVATMRWTVDGLQRLFGARGAAARTLRNAGLDLVNRQKWLKRLLVGRAVG